MTELQTELFTEDFVNRTQEKGKSVQPPRQD